ncbi:hypothetical protein ABT160_18705 [Streptomyces sp. NPDC001941]|uniref:hypothetical protein n=1 Tax=Streptomyces sp. NPDC001941 TaxID=3154659 RepID=UPI00332C98A6
MTDRTTSSAGLAHYSYAEAVAHCDNGPAGPFAPDEWTAYRDASGRMSAVFHYRRTELTTVTDHRGAEQTLTPVVDGHVWPHGLALGWNESDGWSYAPLRDERGTTGEQWTSLPVPRLASPGTLREILPLLLSGHEALPGYEEQWADPRAETLERHLAPARHEVPPRTPGS